MAAARGGHRRVTLASGNIRQNNPERSLNAPGRDRTDDLRSKNPLLFQLSYGGRWSLARCGGTRFRPT